MSCCGKKRESSKTGQGVTVVTANATPVFLSARVPVVFCGTGPYLVEGPVSHEVYYFSPKQAEQLIDAADAAVLLKSSMFKRKNVVEPAATLAPLQVVLPGPVATPEQMLLQPLADDLTEA